MLNKLKEQIAKWKKEINFKEHFVNSVYMHAYYHCKVKKNVAFVESRTGEDLAGNMFRIVQELTKRNLKLYVTVKKGYEEKVGRLLRLAGAEKVTLVPLCSLRYYRVLATAKYLFNDVVFDWKYIKKEGQVYVNTWHGTPLKSLGYDVNGEQYLMGNGQRNLMMADYIAMPNRYCAEHLISCYRLNNLFHGKILYSGYPRNQVFFDDANRETVRKALGLQGKKVYVYMPTWRGTHNNTSTAFVRTMMTMFEYLDANFTDEQVLYVKLHNMMKAELDLTGFQHIREFSTEYEPYEVLNCADCLITDYSSVFFDYACTGRDIVLYVPDKEEYFNGRGMYMTIDELPFPQVATPAELLEAINSGKHAEYPEFIKEYCTYDSKDCTERLLRHVIDGENICHEEAVVSNGKKNVAIYSGDITLKNGINTSMMNLLSTVDTSKCNVYLAFYRKTTKANCDVFSRLPEDVGIFSVSSSFFMTLKERRCYDRFYKKNKNTRHIRKVLDRMYHREIKKLFYDAPFDVLVHFEGYGTGDSIPLFQRYPKTRVIYVHNDMQQETLKKRAVNPVVLREAYQNYDKIAIVAPDLVKPTMAVGAPREKLMVVNNLHDAKGIRLRAEEDIVFESDTECRTYHPGGIEGVLSSPGKKFITIGRFSGEKGHQRLLRTFDKFCEDFPDTQLIIIGGYGHLYNKTLTWARQLKHWQNVTIIKSIKNPMPILKRCDLFILPSYYEGLGLVLLEADCLGVPTFSTKIVGPTRLCEGFGGTLVENSDYGILQGMYRFMDGKIGLMQMDYEAYNKRAISEFHSMVLEDKMSETISPAFTQNNVPVVFSSNDAFVPVMATMIQSIIEQASAEHNYDIIILTQDISMGYEIKLKSMVKDLPNFSLRVVNVAAYVSGYDLYTANRETITVETYFRLVLPELLPDYKKVLYLDGDMVVNADVAELYETDIEEYLLASSRDADGIGRCHIPGDDRLVYRQSVLKMKNLDDYFCAGTLLMNLEKFRAELPTEKLLEVAASRHWEMHDQDVLNVLCEGKVKLVSMAWDVLRDAGNNRYMPGELYEEFLESEKNPKIIHYGGMRKPWIYPDVERGEYFWRYAGRTPFYQEILSLVNENNPNTMDMKEVKNVALKLFRDGRIGFRYVIKYSVAWLKFKVFGKKK
ncbi:MAG: glycosyltransferase [Lachnospiraceae bacterium]|nr:glycosyltransferase [Lachnospiraceae bacterium]